MAIKFNPSHPSMHSEALVPVRRAARRNASIFKSKKQNYSTALKKFTKAQVEYERCKGRRLKKGKKSYPEVEEGFGSTDCSRDYKEMQDQQAKIEKYGAALGIKLKSKGKMTPDLERALNETRAVAQIGGARGTASVSQSTIDALDMAETEVGGIDEVVEEDNSLMYWGFAIAGVAVVGGVALFAMRRR